MARKPKENYYQLTGRPHIGMNDPEMFGLELDEVVRLVDSGRWRSFYIMFLRKKKKQELLESLNYTCPICKQGEPEPNRWKNDGTSCIRCVNVKNKENGAAYQAKGKRGQAIGGENKSYCSVCYNYRNNVTRVGEAIICLGCIRKI